jgi:signal transduction histidine kinase
VGSGLVKLSTEYEPNLGRVEVVVQDIQRVFVNIVSNALDAVERRRRQSGADYVPTLSIKTLDRGDRVEVRVRDNGIGIPASSLDLIFQPFFTTKPPGEGTGLGLSISHDIVVRGHGGELRAEGLAGEFAEFVVVLPRRSAPLR